MDSTDQPKAPSSEASMTFETPLKHITVKTLTGKSFTIDVKANDIVHVVKDKFQKKLGIPQEQQRLIFGATNGKSGWKEWRDSLTLGQIGVKEGEVVYLVLTLGGGVRRNREDTWFATLSKLPAIAIFVRTTSGKEFLLKVHSSETVWKLKLRIQDRESLPATQQRVTFGEKELEDTEWLAKYDLSEGSEVRVQSTAFEQELSKLLKKVEEDMKKFMLRH